MLFMIYRIYIKIVTKWKAVHFESLVLMEHSTLQQIICWKMGVLCWQMMVLNIMWECCSFASELWLLHGVICRDNSGQTSYKTFEDIVLGKMLHQDIPLNSGLKRSWGQSLYWRHKKTSCIRRPYSKNNGSGASQPNTV